MVKASFTSAAPSPSAADCKGGTTGYYPKGRMQPPEGASARALGFISVTQAQMYTLKTRSLSQQPMRSGLLPTYR